MTELIEAVARAETCVCICPQCEGEGSYADGLGDDACTTECTRCKGNGWIVDLTAITDAGYRIVKYDPATGSIRVMDCTAAAPGDEK